MKYILIVTLCFFLNTDIKAQVKPIYFVLDSLVITDKNKATSYGIYGKLSGEDLWTFKKYNLYDELILSGTYEDEKLAIPHGEFVYYQSVAEYNDDNEREGFLERKTKIYIYFNEVGLITV